MATTIGVTVVETDARSTPPITAAPTSTAGFVVCSERGVPDQAVRIRGFADFVNNFGGYIGKGFGAYAVRGFFDNGGTAAYVVRVVDSATPAGVTLSDSATTSPKPALEVTAGARGRPDPGAWGNTLSVDVESNPLGSATVPAQLAGSKIEPFALAEGDDLQFTITNRGSDRSVSITFAATDFAAIGLASAQEVAAAINRQTTDLRAGAAPGGQLLVAAVSTDPRVWSSLKVGGAAATTLGFSATADGLNVTGPALALSSASGFRTGSVVRIATRGHVLGTTAVAATVTGGAGIVVNADGRGDQLVVFRTTDFANPAGITVAEVAAAINRQAVGFTAEVTHNNMLALLSNKDGTGSTIAIKPTPTGVTDARTQLGLPETATAGTHVHRTLTAASETYRAIGWATAALNTAIRAGVLRVSTVEFDLAVRRSDVEVERFTSLSMAEGHSSYFEAVVNDPDRGSAYITVTDQSTSEAGVDTPTPGRFPLIGGGDGEVPADTKFLGDAALRTGVEAFEGVPIQLLACPETTSVGVAAGFIGYCERRGDATFVGTVPRGFDRDSAKAYASALRGRKVYGALYGPWIQVTNPVSTAGAQPLVWIPPVGQILGAYARIADARGVWKAPAGDEARLAGALGVEYDMTDADHTDLVRAGGVNGIRAVPGSGIVVDASRTLSTDTRWLFVNVRRLFNFVKSSLRDGLTWVAQEPHTDGLRRAVRLNVVTPFLLGLWRQGAFGSDPADQVFTVKCDADNNPPAEVAAGNFTVEVYFYPVKPAESILIVVGQQDSGASAAEA